MNVLKEKRILIVGLGGVGSYTAEVLTRSGIGKFTLVDADDISLTNINRQLPALPETIGKVKVEVIRERLLKINPTIEIEIRKEFINDERITEIIQEYPYDFIVDAIDSVSPKVWLLRKAYEQKIPIVSSMGAGGRFDPTKVIISDISKTCQDGLSRNVRIRLNKWNIKSGIPCVFSSEEADKSALMYHEERFKKSSFGTLSYMTSLFGLKCAEVVLSSLLSS